MDDKQREVELKRIAMELVKQVFAKQDFPMMDLKSPDKVADFFDIVYQKVKNS